MVWTVNQADDIRRLLDWGVDGLITDRPDIAVPLVRDWVRAARRPAGQKPEARSQKTAARSGSQ